MKAPKNSEQKTIVLNGILVLTITLVILQLWLLMATMNAFLGNDLDIVWPAAGASLVCFLLIAGLVSYIRK